MKLLPLEQFSHHLQPGVALPWGVRDSNGKLLLARGHVMADAAMVSTLLERGMFVDADEINRANGGEQHQAVKDESLSSRWAGLQSRLGVLLRSPTEAHFLDRVRESIDHIGGLADRNTDLLIFLILRHDHTRYANYGVVHSLHVASLCGLVTRRLNWPDARRNSLIGAALTMNLSILDLQGRLAAQTTPLGVAQRRDIDGHTAASAKLLRAAGLQDKEWLETVEQHHEQTGGTGYPNKLPAPSESSQLLRFVDCFTAKHSARAGRTQQPAQQAARDLYTQSKANPLAALLIKEFGIYPPGCFVKLASGETAIVIRRGAGANTPIVATITNRNGDALTQPIPRDTSVPAHAIAATVPDKAVLVRLNVDQLYSLRPNT
jgi:HD-GYP domain-containing protein (c-di-GMP phosphodiesterase class II)